MKDDSDRAWIPTRFASEAHLHPALCFRPQSLVSMSRAKIMRNEPRSAFWLTLHLIVLGGLRVVLRPFARWWA
jgi:hypothetical protein